MYSYSYVLQSRGVTPVTGLILDGASFCLTRWSSKLKYDVCIILSLLKIKEKVIFLVYLCENLCLVE